MSNEDKGWILHTHEIHTHKNSSSKVLRFPLDQCLLVAHGDGNDTAVQRVPRNTMMSPQTPALVNK